MTITEQFSVSRIDGIIGDPGLRFRALQDRLHDMGTGVTHEAANIPCGASLGMQTSQWGDGIEYQLRCKKRVGHAVPKGEKPHVAVDYRIVASPHRVVHTERFKPNTMPAGIDMTITIPHDCANHLADVEALSAEAYRRGR